MIFENQVTGDLISIFYILNEKKSTQEVIHNLYELLKKEGIKGYYKGEYISNGRIQCEDYTNNDK